LSFIQNKNQWPESIDFRAEVPGGAMFISAKGFSVLLIDQEKLEQEHLDRHQLNESDGMPAEEKAQAHYFQINFLGANLQAKAVPSNPPAGYYNYFLGNDTCRWASNVLAFNEIVYQEIYLGIDLKISSLGQNLKYDFVVKPGADPHQIQIEYCGLDRIEMTEGNLSFQTSLGIVTDQKPLTFQIENGKKKIVQSQYALTENIASFYFPDGYDECHELVIDPLLIFSTYSGSTADNWGSTATPGEHRTLYSSGVTNFHDETGVGFPATPGAFQTNYGGNYDIAIIKYDSAGTKFFYATYLGGSSNETPHSLLMDKVSEDLIVLGTTSSPDYPISGNAFDNSFNFGQPVGTHVIPYQNGTDIVISRINKSGSRLIASTFIGGNLNDGLNVPTHLGGELTKNYGDEMRGDVTTDAHGNIFISSVSSSSDFPVTAGFGNSFAGGGSDAIIMKLSSDLDSVIWSGFLGGSLFDAAYSIKFDKDQHVIVAGGTTSGNFPITTGAYQTVLGGNVDGWIARITSDGSSVLQSTFTGTTSYDQVYFVDLNAHGDIFVMAKQAGRCPLHLVLTIIPTAASSCRNSLPIFHR
jgi:hypothetical protein